MTLDAKAEAEARARLDLGREDRERLPEGEGRAYVYGFRRGAEWATQPRTVTTAEARIAVARIVAEDWRDSLMRHGYPLKMGAHPLAMVLAALDGETDPAHLGIDSSTEAADQIRAITGGERS